jgi:hypothetical protein
MNNKKYYAFFSLIIILAFMGYIIYDSVRPSKQTIQVADKVERKNSLPDQWRVQREVFIRDGLKAVAVSNEGDIYLGGDSFVSCYNKEVKEIWTLNIPEKITAAAIYGDTVYASSAESIFLIDKKGSLIGEWGPYEADCMITSLSANKDFLAVADASNKIVFIIRKDGEVNSMIGHFGEKLHIPSPYFDVCLTSDNRLLMANTGNFRIEERMLDGQVISAFGVSGFEPGSFCGCCNPAHFAIIPQGFVTAEKGINRIKILDPEGGFVEFVSAKNNFVASAPLDIASGDGVTIYGANPADSKLYVFTRINQSF